MDYKQLSADDQFPTVNSSLVGENKYALGTDIPLLVGISVWDTNASYLSGHVIIYNNTINKGLFLVVTDTAPNEAPDNLAGAAKFKSLGLSYIPNTSVQGDSIGYQRTGKVSFVLTGSGTTDSIAMASDLIIDSVTHKVSGILFTDDLSVSLSGIVLNGVHVEASSIIFKVTKTTAGSLGLGDVMIAYTIEG